jgi:ribosomal protein S4E
MNLIGWTLMNMENQTCSFPANFTLKAGSIVKVHAGKGNNTATDLYNSALVWNRKSDTVTLEDATGKNVSEYKYPVNVSAPVNATKYVIKYPLNTPSKK